MDYQPRTWWEVGARIDGRAQKVGWLFMGNLLDAGVLGAVDPNRGTATMLETARAFGQLLKQSWRPRRTIILCSWDGEEYGLIGSTQRTEENAPQLQTKTVAYFNVYVSRNRPNYASSSVPSLWKPIWS